MGKPIPIKTTYGYFADTFYEILPGDLVVMPETTDYTKFFMNSAILNAEKTDCEVNLFKYHTLLASKDNKERSYSLVENIANSKPEKIETIHNQYAMAIEYTLYSNDGQVIAWNEYTVKAYSSMGMVFSDKPKTLNDRKFRKCMVFDAVIPVKIPETFRYGIKQPTFSYPYTLKVNSIKVFGFKGNGELITDTEIIDNTTGINSVLNYNIYGDKNIISDGQFTPKFINNAKVGTTMIGQTVRPVEISGNRNIEKVVIANLSLEGNENVITLNYPLRTLNINAELILDNIIEIDVKQAITSIIDQIKGKVPEDVTQPTMNITDPVIEGDGKIYWDKWNEWING